VIDALPPELQIVLTGVGAEAALIAAIEEAASRSCAAALDLPWDTLAALYAEMDLVAGLDSGPMHLATAVGTPTVRIYGPTDPAIYGPAGPRERHAFVQSSLPCAPCGNLVAPPCGYLADPPCLAEVRVAEVATLIRERIGARLVV
jgi:ADP-heptose:LPS heptosyltransferase